MELITTFLDFILHVDKYLEIFVTNNGTWVYALLFAIIFVETGLVVMPFLPGDSLLFVVGAMCAGRESVDISGGGGGGQGAANVRARLPGQVAGREFHTMAEGSSCMAACSMKAAGRSRTRWSKSGKPMRAGAIGTRKTPISRLLTRISAAAAAH